MIEKLLIGSIESDYSQCRVDIKFSNACDDSVLLIFKAISCCGVLVDVVSYSSFNSCAPILFFTIKKCDVDTAVKGITTSSDSLGDISINVDIDIVIISVIGIGIRANSFVISEICRIFVNYGADIKSLSISEIRIEIITTASRMIDSIVMDLESVFL